VKEGLANIVKRIERRLRRRTTGGFGKINRNATRGNRSPEDSLT
jgi:hypothetical protein